MSEDFSNWFRWISRSNQLLLIACFVLACASIGTAQNGRCAATELEKLRDLGPQQTDPSRTRFEIGGTRFHLTCKWSTLAAIQVDFEKPASRSEYDRTVATIEQIKTLGVSPEEQPMVTIGPSGWTSRSTRYSKAYIVRREHTCAEGKKDCGIKSFTVFYWLPFSGKVQTKHIERVAIKNVTDETHYYVTVAGRRIAVSASDYERLKKGQHVSLELTIGNDFARIKG